MSTEGRLVDRLFHATILLRFIEACDVSYEDDERIDVIMDRELYDAIKEFNAGKDPNYP